MLPMFAGRMLQHDLQCTAGKLLCYCAVLVSAGLLAVSLLHYLHTPTHTEALDYLKYVALGAIALEAPLIGLKALASLRRKARS